MSDGIKIAYWNRVLGADKIVICTPQNFSNVIENLALSVADTIPHKDYDELGDNLVKLLEAAARQAREHQHMRKLEKHMERNRPKLFAAKFARETSRTLRRKRAKTALTAG
jgi:hypothetical protein